MSNILLLHILWKETSAKVIYFSKIQNYAAQNVCTPQNFAHANMTFMMVHSWELLITVTVCSKAWTLFAHSNAGIMGSNPTQDMHVYVCVLFCVCVVLRVGSGLATDWSLVQGAEQRAVEPLMNEMNEIQLRIIKLPCYSYKFLRDGCPKFQSTIICKRPAFLNLWSAMMGQVVRKQT
jgi:hypothetical protein